MYYKNSEVVPIPTEGHKHITHGYVMWENDGKWDNEKKQSIDSRVSIGRVSADDPKMMHPNKKYFELFGPKEEIGKISGTLNYGAYEALTATGEKVGCLGALQEAFPEEWEKIFALALHEVVAHNGTSQDFSEWMYSTYCGLDKPLSTKEISALYKKIGKQVGGEEDGVKEFLVKFYEFYRENINKEPELAVAFDSTNQNTQAKKTDLAEKGHPKKEKSDTKQINTAVFDDEKTGIPFFYQHFYGSVLDKSQTPYTLETIADMGFSDLLAVMDSGYYSAKVASTFEQFKLKFSVMAPENTNVAKEMVENHANEIVNKVKYYIPDENAYGIRIADMEALDGHYTAYLYYDPKRGEEERQQIYRKVQKKLAEANERKRYTEKFREKYSPWLIIKKCEKDPTTGRNFTVKVDDAAVQAALDEAGLFVVVSNSDSDAPAMLRYVRLRDRGEKVFARLKSFLGIESAHTHSDETYKGKMFVSFVAMILSEAFRWFERDYLHSSSPETVATCISTLNKYQMIAKEDGSWMPYFAATKKIKDILEPLGVTETQMEKHLRSVTSRVG